jgi:hypothetical protein
MIWKMRDERTQFYLDLSSGEVFLFKPVIVIKVDMPLICF